MEYFFFGHSDKMRDLASKADRIAQSSVPILIEGETGTGKERLANHLHQLRAAGGRLSKFVYSVSSSTVFEQATHTPEMAVRLGEANNDTVLLNRVHRLPSTVQDGILRSLDGIRGPFPFLISTTSGSLERLVHEGRFLPELFYRLSAYRIVLPPLRDRLEDIPHLFRAMLDEMAQQKGVAVPRLETRAVEVLRNYSWPGNLRELQNVTRSYLLASDPLALERDIERRRNTPLSPWVSVALKEQVKQAAKQVEGEIILRALEQCHWNRRLTAEALRISYRSLMYKMKNCNLRGDSGMRHSSLAQ